MLQLKLYALYPHGGNFLAVVYHLQVFRSYNKMPLDDLKEKSFV